MINKNDSEIVDISNDSATDEVYFDGEKIQITDDMDEAMAEQMDAINKIINTEIVDTTTALNILINVAQITFESELLNDLDRHLIGKAFASIQNSIDTNNDFVIKLGSD